MDTLNRRQFLQLSAAGLSAAACAGLVAQVAEAEGRRLNVLHIISDDLCARLGCYGFPEVKTPNLDAFAARGVKFDNCYCQYPLCNPSRASFMTGLRPDTLEIYENVKNFRVSRPETVTLAQSFRKAGYHVARVGKIYHYGVPREIGTSGMDDPDSWEQYINPRGRDVDDISMVEVLHLGEDGKPTTVTGRRLTDVGGTVSWLAADGTDDEQTDAKGATSAIGLMEKFKQQGEPFYLAVGFFRPHTPYVAPKAYYDLYPLDKITLPDIPADYDSRVPEAALQSRKPEQNGMSDDLRRRAIQGYYAAMSFMDAEVGRLLDAVDRLKLADDTLIFFHSDHGYHLGEKNLWQKMSIFEESVKVPMIIALPGNKAKGETCKRVVELVALHKTIAELCGVPADPAAEGHSFKPLVEDPSSAWDHPAFSQVQRTRKDLVMGRSVRKERWRYTEWNNGAAGAELYDHDNDPHEMNNLAKDPAHAETIAKLKPLLKQMGQKA